MAATERQATSSDKTPLQQTLYQHKGLQQTPPTITPVIQPNLPLNFHPLQTTAKTLPFEERESELSPSLCNVFSPFTLLASSVENISW